jgi:hypothetical protein
LKCINADHENPLFEYPEENLGKVEEDVKNESIEIVESLLINRMLNMECKHKLVPLAVIDLSPWMDKEKESVVTAFFIDYKLSPVESSSYKNTNTYDDNEKEKTHEEKTHEETHEEFELEVLKKSYSSVFLVFGEDRKFHELITFRICVGFSTSKIVILNSSVYLTETRSKVEEVRKIMNVIDDNFKNTYFPKHDYLTLKQLRETYFCLEGRKTVYRLNDDVVPMNLVMEKVEIPIKITDVMNASQFMFFPVLFGKPSLPRFDKSRSFLYVVINHSRISLLPFDMENKFKDVKRRLGVAERIKDLSRIHLRSIGGLGIKDEDEEAVILVAMNFVIPYENLILMVDIDVDITVLFPGQHMVIKEKIKYGKTSLKEIKNAVFDIFKDLNDQKQTNDSDLKICLLERLKYKKGFDYGKTNNADESLLYPFTDYLEEGLEKCSDPPDDASLSYARTYYKQTGKEFYMYIKNFDDWGLLCDA